MLGKKLVDLAFKPFSGLSMFRGLTHKSSNFTLNSDLTIDQSYRNYDQENNDKEERRNYNSNDNQYNQQSSQSSYNTSMLFPLILYMTNKLTSAKCLFSSDKPDVK